MGKLDQLSLAALIATLLCAVPLPGRLAHWAWHARRLVRRHPGRTTLLFGVATFLGCVLVAQLLGPAFPAVQDEFSYLLAADTFAHGRLANPTHPCWKSFETEHVVHQPRYFSKYPPGQGMALGLGQALTGDPLVGVWIALALAIAALHWMLRAWLPAGWAFVGAAIALVRLVFLGNYYEWASWSHSYWGGGVATLGGALMFGALRRLWRGPSAALSAVLALGLLILANSRPFEGLLASLPVAVALSVWMWRRRARPALVVRSVAAPLAIGCVLIGAWVAYYNYSTTGDPLLMPYQAHEHKYADTPFLLFEALSEPKPQAVGLCAQFHAWERNIYTDQHSWSGYWSWVWIKAGHCWRLFSGTALTLPLLASAFALTSRWMRFAAGVVALIAAAALSMSWFSPHYAAPITCLIFLFITQGLRVLSRRRPAGPAVVRCVLTVYAMSLAVMLVDMETGRVSIQRPWSADRGAVRAALEARAGKHLVIVRYKPDHDCHAEWVFNGADLDGARVVWARELSGDDNRKLLTYYKDRSAWVLEADEHPPVLSPAVSAR